MHSLSAADMETLNALPENDEMPVEQHLLIILNSAPTKNLQIWKLLIDIDKVKGAFLWLIKNNPFCKDVHPDWCPLDEMELTDEDPPNAETIDSFRAVAKKPMIRKIDKAEGEFLISRYTVHPLSPNVPQESDLEQYQMQRVEAQIIGSREKN